MKPVYVILNTIVSTIFKIYMKSKESQSVRGRGRSLFSTHLDIQAMGNLKLYISHNRVTDQLRIFEDICRVFNVSTDNKSTESARNVPCLKQVLRDKMNCEVGLLAVFCEFYAAWQKAAVELGENRFQTSLEIILSVSKGSSKREGINSAREFCFQARYIWTSVLTLQPCS